ncbi:hypothetical protein EB796_004219 [Bugula neritina]|uniref:Uncharacterized protein n=1 Tax=Bugula neritina TaxID=10212 RepID=A0A7J7KFU6_BUGNE|nr:hypothetical protein EB796_004219 [Bugula neritina]
MERAAEYLKENTALSNASCWAQIERYVRWPGQACSYKIGELKIKEIRQRAEQELGASLSIPEFHKALLDLGPCPLQLMEDEMNKWIESSKPVESAAHQNMCCHFLFISLLLPVISSIYQL